jgi:hypothetical protein
MDSGGISRLFKKAFWPLPWELNYKKRPLKPSGACYHFSLKKKVSPKKQYPS